MHIHGNLLNNPLQVTMHKAFFPEALFQISRKQLEQLRVCVMENFQPSITFLTSHKIGN